MPFHLQIGERSTSPIAHAGGFYKSIDGGENWVEVSRFPAAFTQPSYLAIAPSAPHILLSIVNALLALSTQPNRMEVTTVLSDGQTRTTVIEFVPPDRKHLVLKAARTLWTALAPHNDRGRVYTTLGRIHFFQEEADMGTFIGSVAIVTGASSGIGAGLAKMLAAGGAKVALVGRRLDELERLAGEISQAGGTALVAPADLRDEEALQKVVVQAETDLGPVDILVNSGGVIHVGSIHELDLEAWDTSMQVNLRAPAVLCAAVLPGMRARRRGYIVNLASEAGVNVYSGMGAYAVSKHGLRVLTELVQKENQAYGIKAWAICPGFVDTPMAGWAPEANPANFLQVEEVVAVVRFLLTQGENVKMGPEILLRTMRNPYARD